MKLEIVIEASDLPLIAVPAAADISETALLIPALQELPVAVSEGIPVIAYKDHDSDPLRDEMEAARFTPIIPYLRNRVKQSRNDDRR